MLLRVSDSNLLIALSLLITLSACSYKHLKDGNDPASSSGAQPPTNGGTISNREGAQISFEEVRSKVLVSKCMTCHQEYGNYARAYADRESIRSAVFIEKRMPKRGALTAEEAATLKAWLDTGAHDTVDPIVVNPTAPLPSTSPSPSPSPSLGALPITGPESISWNHVQKSFFEKHCTTCHDSSDVSGTGLDLSKYEQVRANATKIMGRVIVEQDMPPGPASVSAEEKLLLVNWISAKMPGPEDKTVPAPAPSTAPSGG